MKRCVNVSLSLIKEKKKLCDSRGYSCKTTNGSIGVLASINKLCMFLRGGNSRRDRGRLSLHTRF